MPSPLSKFSSEDLEAELNRRFHVSVIALKKCSPRKLYEIAEECGEESHEDGVNCLPCEAWAIYCDLPYADRERVEM